MAEVTGMTAEAIDELMADMVIGFHLDETGQLIYETRGGEEGNAGPIIAPNLAVEKAWPVGSIFITTVNTNPNALTGIGTWARFAKGKTLVSLDEDQTEFDTPQETGGNKTITLAAINMPKHDHDMAHVHQITASYSLSEVSNDEGWQRLSTWNFGSGGDIDRSANTGQPVNAATANRTGPAGGNIDTTTEPFNNLPPYVVVYMWRRTA